MYPIRKILVIGAGELGTEVLRSLAQHPRRAGITIAVLLRASSIASTDSKKEKEIKLLRSLGIDLIPGDIAQDSRESLGGIFQAFDTIIGCTGFSAGAGTQLKLAQIVLSSQVPRYIPWQFGVDYDIIGRGSAQDLFDEQLDVRELLRSQTKTRWVIISTGMFTSFLFEPSFKVVDFVGRSVTALGSWDNQVSVTAPSDIGKITAEVVLGEKSETVFHNKPIYIAGDTLSYAQLSDLVEGMTGQNFTKYVRTVEEAKNDLETDPGNTLYKYQVVFGQGRGVSWSLVNTWNHQNGIRALTAEEWARTHLKF